MAARQMARKALTSDDSAREVRHATMADAHAACYSALNGVCTGSADGMETVWSHGTDVSDFGPDGRSHLGWNAVIDQFRKEGAGWRLMHHRTDQAAPMAGPSGSPSTP
jgi:ribosomal protein S18 acetylase RimI-like enzyme